LCDFCRKFYHIVELYMLIYDYMANKKGVICLRSAYLSNMVDNRYGNRFY
jgi:hypothetical protein